MILQGQAELNGCTPEAVLRVLTDAQAWSDWVPGLASVASEEEGIRLEFSDPLRSWVVVDRTVAEQGISLQLVEGTPTDFFVMVDLLRESVTFSATIRLKTTLPGPLRSELLHRYPARFLAALLSRA